MAFLLITCFLLQAAVGELGSVGFYSSFSWTSTSRPLTVYCTMIWTFSLPMRRPRLFYSFFGERFSPVLSVIPSSLSLSRPTTVLLRCCFEIAFACLKNHFSTSTVVSPLSRKVNKHGPAVEYDSYQIMLSGSRAYSLCNGRKTFSLTVLWPIDQKRCFSSNSCCFPVAKFLSSWWLWICFSCHLRMLNQLPLLQLCQKLSCFSSVGIASIEVKVWCNVLVVAEVTGTKLTVIQVSIMQSNNANWFLTVYELHRSFSETMNISTKSARIGQRWKSSNFSLFIQTLPANEFKVFNQTYTRKLIFCHGSYFEREMWVSKKLAIFAHLENGWKSRLYCVWTSFFLNRTC